MSEEIVPQKFCPGCKRSKPLTEFPREKRKKDGYNARCKECCNGYNGKYRTTHVHEPADIADKQCSHCKRNLPIERFFKDPQSADGYRGECIDCRNKWHRGYENELTTGIRPHKEVSTKRCYKCKITRPIDDFHVSKGELDGHRDICKFCQQPIGAEWRASDPDYFKRWRKNNQERVWVYDHTPKNILRRNELKRKRNALNPYKHRQEVGAWQKRRPDIVANIQQRHRAKTHGLAATFTFKDKQRMLNYWHGRCAYCGRLPGFWHFLAEEHFVAENNGGPYTPDNILPACHARRGAPAAIPNEYCNNSKSDNDPEQWLIRKLGPTKAKRKLEEIRLYFEWIKETSHDPQS